MKVKVFLEREGKTIEIEINKEKVTVKDLLEKLES